MGSSLAITDRARAAAASSKVTNFRVKSVGFFSSALTGTGITALRLQMMASLVFNTCACCTAAKLSL